MVSVTSLDVFKKNSGLFAAVFVAAKEDICDEQSGHLQPCLCRQNQVFMVRSRNISSCSFWQPKTSISS